MRRVILGLVVCLLPTGTSAEDDEAILARLNSEAKVLLVQVIKDLGIPIGPCDLEPKWSDYGVPYCVAHEYLGLEIHANLQNPDGVAGPDEVLAAAGATKADFCDDAAFRASIVHRIEAWRAAFRALPAGSKPPAGFAIYRRSYSFPAFDRDFFRAVVVLTQTYLPYAFDTKGEVKRTTLSGGAVALVYRLDKRGWKKGSEVEMANWD